MFFALWQSRRKHVARDRFNVKEAAMTVNENVLPSPLLLDLRRKKHPEIIEMKSFGTHTERTLKKMERLVTEEARQHSL
uniref:Uncharacterized protein n=1 Tax=Meloidogyne floridensis TaxID=298350 RepID=A0A915NLT9_9BILA